MSRTTAARAVAFSAGLALMRRNDRLAAAGIQVPEPSVTAGPASVLLYTLRVMVRSF